MNKETLRNIKRTWQFAKKKKFDLFVFLIASLFLCVISVVVPLISAKIVINITSGLFDKLLFVASALFVFEISRNIFRYISNRAAQRIYYATSLDIQIKVADETLKLETKEIDNNSSGLFISRLQNDTREMANIFVDITAALTDVLTNIGILGAIFIVNKVVFLYIAVSLIVIYLIENKRMKSYFKQDAEFRKLNEKTTGLISELVRGIRDIKGLNAGKTFMFNVIDRVKIANEKKYEMSTTTRRYGLVSGSIKDSVDLLFIILCVFLVTRNELTIDNFVILYMYQSRVGNLMNYLVRFSEIMRNFNLSSNRVFEVIENQKFAKEHFGNKQLCKVNGNFEFKNVNFAYNDKNQILKNMSFKIKANETVAFVGKSGGGKTTIFSLLDKLYTVNSGEILIDGVNINELDQDSIRDNISIITQSPYIFNFSIKFSCNLLR